MFPLFELSHPFETINFVRKEQQIKDAIVLIKKRPDQCGNLIYDMYRILCHGFTPLSIMNNFKPIEVILKSKIQLAVAMIEGGLLSVLPDIILAKNNPNVLVCYYNFF